ncbi:MAG: RNA methyltransferase, partial [Paludibacteraceae bacterium]|nr:RNA methyltransferase [Paludibacteraceae bacterium]
ADAIKTSAGALHTLPVCKESSLTSALKFMKKCGIRIIAASEKGTLPYTESNMKDPVAIVMGAEDKGVSPEVLRICDEMVSIPILGKISSLNVSVAAGVMIYEAVRQRGKK